MTATTKPDTWACVCDDAVNPLSETKCWNCQRTRKQSDHLKANPAGLTLGDIIGDDSRLARIQEHAEHAGRSVRRYLQSLLWELSATKSGAVSVVVHMTKDEERWLEDRANAARMPVYAWITSLVKPKHEPSGTFDRNALAARLSANKQERQAIWDEEMAHVRPLLDAAKTREEATAVIDTMLDTVNKTLLWSAMDARFPEAG